MFFDDKCMSSDLMVSRKYHKENKSSPQRIWKVFFSESSINIEEFQRNMENILEDPSRK